MPRKLRVWLWLTVLIAGIFFGPIGSPGQDSQLSPRTPGLINARDFGAKGDGIADDTQALQKALDVLTTRGGRLYLPAGDYRVGPLYFPERVIIEGDGDSTVLRFRGESGYLLSPKETQRSNRFVHIRDLSLDLAGVADVGIRLTNCWHSSVKRVTVRNVSAGTYQSASVTLPCSGIAIQGTSGKSTAPYNTLEQCFVEGKKIRYGNSGFYLSSSTEDSPQKANFNRLIQCRVAHCQIGINLANGNDIYLEMPEVSTCTIGIRIKSKRNYILKAYAEKCQTAVLLEKGSKYNMLFLRGSLSETNVAVTDHGEANVLLYRPADLYLIYKNIHRIRAQ